MSGDSCVPVVVPTNAYLASSGRKWECERGFRKHDDACVALVLPTNAHIGFSGDDWNCDAGYRRQGETCIPDER
jgi:hypothetical protein